jgi:hypothetical protein
LFLHGSHRRAGTRNNLHNPASAPPTYSGAIICKSKFPQIEQCAYNKCRIGTGRA